MNHRKKNPPSPSLPQPIHPIPPRPPLRPPQTRLAPFIPHDAQPLDIPPLGGAAPPAGLAHQADDRLLLAPALLDGDVGQVRGAVALAVVGKGDADAVGAEGPVERVGRRGEVCEEGGRGGEVGEFGAGDGGEAVVVEGAVVGRKRKGSG